MSFACRPNFRTSGAIDPLVGGTASSEATNPTSATASVQMGSGGTVTAPGDTTDTFADHNWHDVPASGVGNDFWVRFTQVTGPALTTGAALLGVWSQLNSNRLIGYTRSTLGASSGTFTIAIATDSSGANIVSSSSAGAFTLTATQIA